MVALILRVSIVVLAICLPVMSHRQFQNLEKEPMVYHPERYSMTFAVEVLGGGEVAERVAKKYHFKHKEAVRKRLSCVLRKFHVMLVFLYRLETSKICTYSVSRAANRRSMKWSRSCEMT